jgi:hypothetical protein
MPARKPSRFSASVISSSASWGSLVIFSPVILGPANRVGLKIVTIITRQQWKLQVQIKKIPPGKAWFDQQCVGIFVGDILRPLQMHGTRPEYGAATVFQIVGKMPHRRKERNQAVFMLGGYRWLPP